MSFDVKRTHPNQGWKSYLFLVQLQLQIQLKPKIFNYNYSSSSNCNLITISITITLKTFSKHCNQFTYIRGPRVLLMSTPVPSPEQTTWVGTSRKWGGTKIDCTFPHKNWYVTAFTAPNSALFERFCIHGWKKRCIRPAAFLSSFLMRPKKTAWKICQQQ